MERYRILGFGLWAVCLKETGEMIGDGGLTMQPINGKIKPEIGYHVRKDQQRKGYAKEAAIAVRDFKGRKECFMEYIRVTSENIDKEHICCAISNDKDIQVISKKAWLRERFEDGLVFLKSTERGKCFIEYIPAENAWNPICA